MGEPFSGDDGPVLSARYLDRPGEPALYVRVVHPRTTRERLLFVHASTVHSEYYLPLALQLARHGIETWLPDLRGHGHSAGQRGHTRAWHEPVGDVLAAWQAMQADPAPSVLIGGESYGALLAYEAVRLGAASPSGAIFLSPAFGLHYHPSPTVYRLLTRWIWPVGGQFRPLRRLPVEGVTQNPALRSLIERDRLCNRHYTLGFLLHLMEAQRAVPKPDREWDIPTLILLSEKDPITDNEVTRAVFDGNPAVSLQLQGSALHSLVADQPVWAAESMADWISGPRLRRRIDH